MDLSEKIIRASASQGVNPALSLAVARVESGKIHDKLFSGGKTPSHGIFQMLTSTAFGHCKNIRVESDLYSPDKSIHCGISYLKSRIKMTSTVEEAIASYNSGSPVICSNLKQMKKYKCSIGDYINREYVNREQRVYESIDKLYKF